MKFKIDENLPIEVADILRHTGHEAHTVKDEQLKGSPDDQLIGVCKREGRALITLDTGFLNIKHYPPEDYNGIIVFRILNQDKNNVVDLMGRIMPFLQEHNIDKHLWIVEQNRVRIRKAEE